MQFQRATKMQSRLRCAIFGPSGSGKTFSALRIANGLGGRIGLIDTEFGSASKYADRFAFDTCCLQIPTIENYIQLIYQASQTYDVLIIDSMSHGWQELLQEIDQLAKSKYRGNSWSAWSEGTPKQKELVRAIQSCPCHIIATMRSKTEWSVQTDERGRSKPMRVGLAPEQGKGIEYEFDLLLELSTEHFCTVIKDRTGKFQDALFEKPGEDFGAQLAAWLTEGQPYQEPEQDIQQPPQPTTPFPEPGEPFQKPGSMPPPVNDQHPSFPDVPPQSLNIMNAIADYFRGQAAKEVPGMTVDFDRLLTVVWNRYGRWPTIQAGANRIKQDVQLQEILVPAQQRAAS
ncbi:MAG: ATP-binding protein [Sedimentisphaerales bacterium]|nr:ATP-binding protein [Sedimentisphaerales bacterium]